MDLHLVPAKQGGERPAELISPEDRGVPAPVGAEHQGPGHPEVPAALNAFDLPAACQAEPEPLRRRAGRADVRGLRGQLPQRGKDLLEAIGAPLSEVPAPPLGEGEKAAELLSRLAGDRRPAPERVGVGTTLGPPRRGGPRPDGLPHHLSPSDLDTHRETRDVFVPDRAGVVGAVTAVALAIAVAPPRGAITAATAAPISALSAATVAVAIAAETAAVASIAGANHHLPSRSRGGRRVEPAEADRGRTTGARKVEIQPLLGEPFRKSVITLGNSLHTEVQVVLHPLSGQELLHRGAERRVEAVRVAQERVDLQPQTRPGVSRAAAETATPGGAGSAALAEAPAATRRTGRPMGASRAGRRGGAAAASAAASRALRSSIIAAVTEAAHCAERLGVGWALRWLELLQAFATTCADKAQ